MEKVNQQFKIEIDSQNNLTLTPLNNKPTHTLIFIHGLDMFPTDFLTMFLQEPINSSVQHFKIVMPCAPVRKLTYLGGKQLKSWFDIKTYENSFTRPFEEAFSSQEILESQAIIEKFIKKELDLLNGDSTKLYIGGFSQGCAMSLHCAFNLDIKFGGVVSIAGYLFEITKYNKEKFEQQNICIIHGLSDKRRPWEEVQNAYKKQMGDDIKAINLVEKMDHEIKTYKCREIVANFFNKHSKL